MLLETPQEFLLWEYQVASILDFEHLATTKFDHLLLPKQHSYTQLYLDL
ncbi:hypothetical protein H6G80_17725 [Nostoc sp. FACHB-87]|nr:MULTISPECIES: hypothetical protein [Nostocaceae]MBD2455912.1 hypothetical protein [Nostoc sp. FACHB-87]MBD2474498.1 hypothetical protein [Anabaena sp. FACHB-83]